MIKLFCLVYNSVTVGRPNRVVACGLAKDVADAEKLRSNKGSGAGGWYSVQPEAVVRGWQRRGDTGWDWGPFTPLDALRMRGGRVFHPKCFDFLRLWAGYEGPSIVEAEEVWTEGLACACCEGTTAKPEEPKHTSWSAA